MKKIKKQCVGIDCSKDQLDVCFGQLTDELQIMYKSTTAFPNSRKGFKQILAWSRKLGDASVATFFAVEATGVYHESLAIFLTDAKQRCSVILPNKVSNFAKTLLVRTVTDKVASKTICTMGLEKNLDVWQKPDQVFVHLKHLTRERERLQKECTASSNQMHAEQYSAYTNSMTIKRGKKRKNFLGKQIAEIELEIKQTVAADATLQKRTTKLCTIPGVGLITAVTVLAETNGFHLFRNGKQLASYAGYDVVEKTSGTSVRGKSRISKKGSAHLRRAMHFPALIAAKDNRHLSKFYSRIEARHPDIKMKAYTAVQRKILLLIYALWKKDEVFIADYKSNKTDAVTYTQNNVCTEQKKPVKEIETMVCDKDVAVANNDAVAKGKKTPVKKAGQPIVAALHELVLDRPLIWSS